MKRSQTRHADKRRLRKLQWRSRLLRDFPTVSDMMTEGEITHSQVEQFLHTTAPLAEPPRKRPKLLRQFSLAT
jgi:hypothetical protein